MLKSSIWAPKAPASLARPSAASIPRSSMSPKAQAFAPSTTSPISPPASVDSQTPSHNLPTKAPAFEPTILKAANTSTPTVAASIGRSTSRSTVPNTPQSSVSGDVPTVMSLSPNSSAADLSIIKTARSASASATTTRPTNEDIYAAMKAANPKISASASIITSSTSATTSSSVGVGGDVPTVTSLLPKSPIIAASGVKVTRTVSAAATITRPTYDNIYAAMTAANPQVSTPAPAAIPSAVPTASSGSDDGAVSLSPKATASNPSHACASTTSKERPMTTVVIARRMIVRALGIKAKEKGSASSGGESKGCDAVEEKEPRLMDTGLGGSRWASPEDRAKAVPRPIEEFWEVQRQGQDKYNKMINETMSLRFDRAPAVEEKEPRLMVIGLGGSRWASPEERAKAVPRPIEEFWEVQRQGQDKYNKMINETMSLRFDRAPVVAVKV